MPRSTAVRSRVVTVLVIAGILFASAVLLWAFRTGRLGSEASVTVDQQTKTVFMNFDELSVSDPINAQHTKLKDQYTQYGIRFSSQSYTAQNTVFENDIPAIVLRLDLNNKPVNYASAPNAVVGAAGDWPTLSNPIVMTFLDPADATKDSTTSSVRFHLGLSDANTRPTTLPGSTSQATKGVKVTAYGTNGNQLTQRSYQASGSHQVDLSTPGIARVVIETADPLPYVSTARFAIDDLQYAMPASSAVPTQGADVLTVTPTSGAAPLEVRATYDTPSATTAAFQITSYSAGCSANKPQNTVTWSALDGATTYTVYRRRSHIETGFTKVVGAEQIEANATKFIDATVDPAVEYDYRVDGAKNGQVSSSQEVRLTAAACAGSDFQITAISTTQQGHVALTWVPVSGATYAVWRTPVGAANLTNLTSSPLPATASSFTDTTAQAGTAYQYHVNMKTSSANLNTQSVSITAGQTNSGYLQQFSWDFGDGTTVMSANRTEWHTYPSVGTYTVILKRWGAEVGKQVVTITSGAQTGDATLVVSKPSYQPGEQVDFTLTNVGSVDVVCTNGAPFEILDAAGAVVFAPESRTEIAQVIEPSGAASWSWNQKSSVGTQVTNGVYTVVVTCGQVRRSASFTIATNTQSVDFVVDPTQGVAPLLVTATYSGTDTGLVWDFGDGTVYPNAASVQTHTYPKAGTYTVTLRSGTKTGSKQVTVLAPDASNTPMLTNTSGGGPSLTNTSNTSLATLVSTGGNLLVNLGVAALISLVLGYIILRRRQAS